MVQEASENGKARAISTLKSLYKETFEVVYKIGKEKRKTHFNSF